MKNPAQQTPKINGNLQEEVLSSSLPLIRTKFICESCDYRWDLPIETAVEDAYTDAAEVHRSEPHVSCPICGSHEINPYEE